MITTSKIIRFALVGALNTLVDFGVLNLMIQIFSWGVLAANTLSFSVAVTNSYFWSKYWTFRDPTNANIRQFSVFVLTNLIGLAISNLVMYGGLIFTHNQLANWPEFWQYNIVKGISIVPVWCWIFLIYEYFIFPRQRR